MPCLKCIAKPLCQEGANTWVSCTTACSLQTHTSVLPETRSYISFFVLYYVYLTKRKFRVRLWGLFFPHRFVLVGLSQFQIPVWTQQTVPTQIFYWPCAICAVAAITNQWSSQCQWERFQLWRFSLHHTLVVNLNMLDGNFWDQIIFMIDSFLFLRLKMFKILVVYVVYWKILHISHNLYCNSWETLWTKCISYSIHSSNMKPASIHFTALIAC